MAKQEPPSVMIVFTAVSYISWLSSGQVIGVTREGGGGNPYGKKLLILKICIFFILFI